MKILIATYWALPHVGGVWAYIQDLKSSLEKYGHEVDVFAKHPDGHSYYILNTGQRVEREIFTSIIAATVRSTYAARHVDPWIIEQELDYCCFALAAAYFGLEKYDLIHTQDVISSRALWQIKPEYIRLISTIHGCLAAEYAASLNGNMPSPTIERYACAREYYGATSSNACIVPTHWLKNTLHHYGVPMDHMEVIPYGMDIEQYKLRLGMGTTYIPPGGVHVISCPARLDKVKGHDSLLDALFKLKQIRSDWVCLFIGDGYLREELEAKTNRLGLNGHVIFMGSRNDVPGLLIKSDIVVLPSISDNHPFAIMEAQIARRPLVVSNAGGIPEMVQHERTGLMASAGNSDELLHWLLVMLHHPVYRGMLAENAYHWGMKEWSLETMFQRTTNAYGAVLGKNHQKFTDVFGAIFGKKRQGNVPWIKTHFRNIYGMNIPDSFAFVDGHILDSIQ